MEHNWCKSSSCKDAYGNSHSISMGPSNWLPHIVPKHHKRQWNDYTCQTNFFATDHQCYFCFPWVHIHSIQAMRFAGSCMFLYSARQTEFLNRSNALKYSSDPSWTPSCLSISMTSKTSICSRELRWTILSIICLMQSSILQLLFFRGPLTSMSTAALLLEGPAGSSVGGGGWLTNTSGKHEWSPVLVGAEQPIQLSR